MRGVLYSTSATNLVLLLVLLVVGLFATVLQQLELLTAGLHHVHEHLRGACNTQEINELVQ